MWRALTVGLLVLGGVPHVGAQQAAAPRLAVRLGAGVSSSDYSCTGCEIDGATGLTAFVAATRRLGRILTLGLEANASRATAQSMKATLLGTLATLGVRASARRPVWATAGLGWVWYTGAGPHSNGPALSARIGVDVPVAGAFAITPYAGYLTMVGKDGPRTLVGSVSTPDDPGVPTRVAALQLGLALTLAR
jgi:hypothetical protein